MNTILRFLLLTMFCIGACNFGSIAQNNILIIWDESPNGYYTQTLISALQAAGDSVTMSSVSESYWNNSNPSLTAFDVVIRLNENLSSELTTAGQYALIDFVENNSGAYVQFEFDAYQFDNNQMQIMEDIILADNTSWTQTSMTFTEVSANASHPVLANVPSTFSTTSAIHTVGSKRVFSTDTSIVLMKEGGNDAVIYREFGYGCVLGFHHAPNFYVTETLSDTNIHQLIINFAHHCGYCGLDVTSFSEGISCYGDTNGAAGVSVSGGVPPYTYEWNTGSTDTAITGLAAGIYRVTISDSAGCTTQKQIEIDTLSAIQTFTQTINSVTCFGSNDGSAAVTVTGGTFPYTYAWNNGSTSDTVNTLPAGEAIVTVTDSNGCQFSDTTEILTPDEIATTFNVTPIDCYGDDDGFVAATAVGGIPPYDYTWSNGSTTNTINNLGFGVYTLTVTDIVGCADEDSIAIFAQYLSPIVDLGDDLDVCIDWPVKVDAQNQGSIFDWSNGSLAQYIYVSSAGTYWVEVTNDNGCVSSDTIVVTTHECVGVEEKTGVNNVEIYPNPTDGIISIYVEYVSLEEAVYTIYDVKGRRVDGGLISKLNAGSSLQIQLEGNPSGTYLFEIKSDAHYSRHPLVIK